MIHLEDKRFINAIIRESSTVVPEFLTTILSTAIEANASDIHINSFSHFVEIRFRIDGELHTEYVLEKPLGIKLIARLKVLAELNVAERRLGQDGKFSFTLQDRTFDIRVATFPCIHGEKAILRILENARAALSLDQLGLAHDIHTGLLKLSNAASGFFLVTGPTGSGKTTTLHAFLSHINRSTKNIVTLEDPVEYTIDGIMQTQVHAEIGLTFENGLRSLLRQDPDVIMVGEIRDKETAQVAVQAALTGHLVLSSLHTNDAPSALIRLMHLGIEPYLITACVQAVLAQRLVRRLCECKVETALTHQEKVLLVQFDLHKDSLYGPKGCALCRNTGYKGRIGVFQYMRISQTIGEYFLQSRTYESIQQKAAEEGMASLAQDACLKLAQGLISIQDFLLLL